MHEVTTDVWTEVTVFAAFELNGEARNRHTYERVVNHLFASGVIFKHNNVFVAVNVRFDTTEVDQVVK
ncbi:hypothetical protein D3C75_1016340 [compost metagenome]